MKTSIILFSLLISFLVVGCNAPRLDVAKTLQEVTPQAPDQPPVQLPAQDTDNAKPVPVASNKTFTITAFQFEFEPSVINVDLGDQVTIDITSTDVVHGFSLPTFGIKERLEPGETITVEFVADKKGVFPFFCSVQCGEGHGGMKGTLVVN